MATTIFRTEPLRLTTLLFLSLFAISCASNSGSDGAESVVSEVPVVRESIAPAAVSLSVTTQKTGNFYLSDASVLSDIEKGSPESLRQAVSKLKRTDDNYSDDEATLFHIATAIMRYAWPQEKITWAEPDRLPSNSYMEILNSVKQGVYDNPSDQTQADFLSLTLPSLLLCSSVTSVSWYSDCLEDLTAAEQLQPDSVLLQYLLSLLYSRLGDAERSLGYVQKAAAATPDTYETAYTTAILLNETGHSDEALQLAETLFANDVYNLTLLKLCARSSFAAGRIDKADSYVAQVLQREPENAEYVLLRAAILYQKGEYLSASSLLDAYARRDTENREYLVLRTRLYRNWTKNNNAALATITQALALYPDDSEVLLLSTEIAMATGLSVNGKTGLQLLEQLEKTDPDNRVTLELLVNQAVLEENWEKAYAASSRLVGEGSVENTLTHVQICLNTNHIVEAESLVMSLYGTYPDNEQVQQQYIRVLIASGRSAQALVLIDKLLPEAQGKVKSALYYEKSRLESSKDNQLADLRSALTANPRNQDALFSLYEYYFDKSDYRKAQYYLKQLIALNNGNTRYLALNTQLDNLVNNRSN